MTDDWMHLRLGRKPTPAQPLMGLTVLAVDDSRFTCDALRLLCLRSGARIRRADCMASARRHLATYRPQVVLVDLGLPDGDGLDLIRELAAADNRPPVVLAISGDPDGAADARDAGAQGFLEKPIASLAAFQNAILEHLPEEARPTGLRLVDTEEIRPDSIALKDDLTHAAQVLEHSETSDALDYVVQFVESLARSAKDRGLADAARALATSRAHCREVGPAESIAAGPAGETAERARGALHALLNKRLAETGAI